MKKKNIFNIITSVAASAVLVSCAGSLNPMPNGHYTDENIDNYPSLLKGFVDKAYSIMNQSAHYLTNNFAYLDCATGMGVLSSETSAMRKFSNNSITPSQDPFSGYWSDEYQAIYYVNRFLKDNRGYNTQYLLSQENDRCLRRDYQGDAYALRAWFEYDLLLRFGGKDKGGNALGYIIVDKLFDQSVADPASFRRGTYDECVEQILKDCDSALFYLPLANRDWAVTNTNIDGAQRWGRFDQISVKALKAMTYLLWASDAYNPGGDVTRWQNAAALAEECIEFKMENDFPHAKVDETSSFLWTDPNSPEAFLAWHNTGNSTTYETNFYPNGFRGSAILGPTQEFVDMFPMANGYPITDSRSGYNAQDPYTGRDPRFYATVFYNGSKVIRSGSSEEMYTFDTYNGGKDQNGTLKSSLTNYYMKKFTYAGWNANDQTVKSLPRTVFPISWREICLVFAESANRAVGPNTRVGNYTAKEVLSFLRNRTTVDGTPGLGVAGDPYLDECAANKDKFEALVKNERAIELCFEGRRFHDLARWNTPLAEVNKPVHRVTITAKPDGSFSYSYSAEVTSVNLPSLYLPMPFTEMQRVPGLVQNAGWTTWGGR